MFGCFYKNELENKMPGMTIENIAAACEGTFVGDRNLVTKEIAGAVTDSRQIQKDYLLYSDRIDLYTKTDEEILFVMQGDSPNGTYSSRTETAYQEIDRLIGGIGER